jgi:hypothetical protein
MKKYSKKFGNLHRNCRKWWAVRWIASLNGPYWLDALTMSANRELSLRAPCENPMMDPNVSIPTTCGRKKDVKFEEFYRVASVHWWKCQKIIPSGILESLKKYLFSSEGFWCRTMMENMFDEKLENFRLLKCKREIYTRNILLFFNFLEIKILMEFLCF